MALAVDIFVVFAGCIYALVKTFKNAHLDRQFFKSLRQFFKPQLLMIYLPMSIAGIANKIMEITDNNVVFWTAAVFWFVNLAWLTYTVCYIIIIDWKNKRENNTDRKASPARYRVI